jgi:uncharacterized protein YyaL (SSP411 family)
MSPGGPGPAWAEWSTTAFARAHALGRPVLLSVVVGWSTACRELDRRTFADPLVRDAIDAAWVPVRVNADVRPDLADRYTLGGWPTTAFLTANGDVLGGGTFVDPPELLAALAGVARVYAERRAGLLAGGGDRAAARDASPPVSPDAAAGGVPAAVTALLAERYDTRWGGFGDGPKAPPAAALRFLLHEWRRDGTPALRAMVAASLDAMSAGAVRHPDDGGFFRAARRADWSEPDQARLLDANAALLVVYAEAAAALDEPRYADVALGIAGYLDTVLRDSHEAAFHPSELVDAPDGERIDPTIHVESNARLASAYLRVSALLERPAFAEAAIGVLEHVLGRAYERGAGLARCLDPRPRVRGLLGDQVAASAALLDASDVSGRGAYADLAEELMRGCLRKMWDEARGAFRDRLATMAGAGDVGRLALPLWPLALNGEAAVVLARLADRTGDADLARRARAILATFAGEWPAHGIEPG